MIHFPLLSGSFQRPYFNLEIQFRHKTPMSFGSYIKPSVLHLIASLNIAMLSHHLVQALNNKDYIYFGQKANF